jgi:hypothetical protein
MVTGVANGRARIFVISGGQQGEQAVRVVPDYQGGWNGGLRVTACTQTGAWATIDFCGSFPVGGIDGYSLSLTQSGDQLTARLSYGSSLVFPSVATTIGADGSASFVATYVNIANGITIDATVVTNSLRVGELTGTVNEVWHLPGVSGEARLAQDIVGTNHTSATALSVGAGGSSGKPRVLDRFATGRR